MSETFESKSKNLVNKMLEAIKKGIVVKEISNNGAKCNVIGYKNIRVAINVNSGELITFLINNVDENKDEFLIKKEHLDWLKKYEFTNLDEVLQSGGRNFIDELFYQSAWELIGNNNDPNDNVYMIEEIIDFVNDINS